ncbi:MAG: MBOAT family protein [Clostridia bacterium]|nr:MBOAT family protein [Clostridia bacterium]
MVFSSLIFLYAFLPLSLLGYVLCRSREAKNICLLVFSLIFYAWGEPKYVFLLMFMALSSWFCALGIERARERKSKKAWLIISCFVDIVLIGFFKYSGLICSVFGQVPEFISNIALPIGISFYTFQLLTYVVDVYRGDAEAQESYWHVLLYAALFHQCIAGPIVRYKTIDHELFVERDGGAELLPGISRFTIGLAKKALLANPCGALADSLILADAAASDPSLFTANLQTLLSQPTLGLWMGVLAFMLQIYLDFSAYSDMAIGMGKMLGLHYLENFDYPYISRSVTEFWRRWHISLGTFFRDYVYIPLGGRRRSAARNVLNLFVVWALTGLWHGASWNFVLWGLYYFVFLLIERAFLKKFLEKLPRLFSHIYLLAVVFSGWVIFRFTDVRLGLAVLSGLLGGNGVAFTDFMITTQLKNNLFLIAVCIAACTPLIKTIGNRIAGYGRAHPDFGRIWNIVVYAVVPVLLMLLSTAALVGDSYNPFIYFQF